MNKYIQKIVSLSLIILICLLALDFFSVISFKQIIKDSISFATLTLIIFSSTATIFSKSSKISKFMSYMILLTIFSGLMIYIITGALNPAIYIGLSITAFSSLVDMIYQYR